MENSIEHRYRGGNIPLHMILSGKIVEGNDISITLQDDGKGMEMEQIAQIESLLSSTVKAKLKLDQNESGNSIGMRNILERIQLYYGERYYLRIVRSDETGTLVEVRIPGQW